MPRYSRSQLVSRPKLLHQLYQRQLLQVHALDTGRVIAPFEFMLVSRVHQSSFSALRESSPSSQGTSDEHSRGEKKRVRRSLQCLLKSPTSLLRISLRLRRSYRRSELPLLTLVTRPSGRSFRQCFRLRSAVQARSSDI